MWLAVNGGIALAAVAFPLALYRLGWLSSLGALTLSGSLVAAGTGLLLVTVKIWGDSPQPVLVYFGAVAVAGALAALAPATLPISAAQARLFYLVAAVLCAPQLVFFGAVPTSAIIALWPVLVFLWAVFLAPSHQRSHT